MNKLTGILRAQLSKKVGTVYRFSMGHGVALFAVGYRLCQSYTKKVYKLKRRIGGDESSVVHYRLFINFL